MKIDWTIQIATVPHTELIEGIRRIEIVNKANGIVLVMSNLTDDEYDYRNAAALCSHLNDSNARPAFFGDVKDSLYRHTVSDIERSNMWNRLGNGGKNKPFKDGE